jgi:WD40 repeat protein
LLALAIAPSGQWFAMAESGVVDFASLVPDAKAETIPTTLLGRAMITSLAISGDGKTLVTGDFQGVIRRWEYRPGERWRGGEALRGHEKVVTSVAVSSDGRTLLSTSADKTARLWDLSSRAPAATAVILRGHRREVFAGALSDDGQFAVTACDDGFARLWGLRSDALLAHARRVAGRALSAAETRSYQIEIESAGSPPDGR